jgi:hypothetical protein
VVNVAKLTRLEEEPTPGGAPQSHAESHSLGFRSGERGIVLGIIVVAAGISIYFATTNDPPVSR